MVDMAFGLTRKEALHVRSLLNALSCSCLRASVPAVQTHQVDCGKCQKR